MSEPITRFRGDYFFLSNFYPCKISYQGCNYPSAEHAYQASKTLVHVERLLILNASRPALAKSLGRHISLRLDWEEVKVPTMREILRVKFSRSSPLSSKLISTGNRELIESNTWGDNFWGMHDERGENHLGRLLMEIRDSLR